MTDSRWDNDLLESMRQQGDPIADAAIAEVFERGQVSRVNDLLVSFDENSEDVPPGLPPLLREYFERTSVLPEWADQASMDRGSDLWGRYGPHLGTILHCSSLPICYGWANAAQVLYRTTRIHTRATRRVMETTQFLSDALEDGGLGSRGRGRRSAQKVRLLHATIRHFLLRGDAWDARLGLPINQEDLAATMGTFSVAVPDGLVRLGVDLPARDRDDFFHIWCVIGHLLGVDARLMPRGFAEGQALMDMIWTRRWAPSEAGKILTKALIDSMRDAVGPALAGAPPSLIRHLCGAALSDMLAVPEADWTSLAIQVQAGGSLAYGKAGDHSQLVAEVASRTGELLLKSALLAANRGNRYDWTVPESERAHREG